MMSEVPDTTSRRYIYFCTWCAWSFEIVFDPEKVAPTMTRCPVCDAHDARLLGAADESTPPGGCCPPGTGCCGTPGSA